MGTDINTKWGAADNSANEYHDSELGEIKTYEQRHEISNNVVYNNVVYTTSKGSDQAAHMHSLVRAFACRLNFL